MDTKQSLKEFEQTVKALGSDKRKIQAFIEIFDTILGSVREPLVVLDSELKAVKANHSFYRTFKVKPEATEGTLIYDLGNRQWDIPKLKELLEDILHRNSTFNDFPYHHDQTQWKVSGKNGAAEILGLNHSTLGARMGKLGILKP